ncbi:MAG: hypothetical protein RIT81_13220 [Deltaproteobacteria bacterium]
MSERDIKADSLLGMAGTLRRVALLDVDAVTLETRVQTVFGIIRSCSFASAVAALQPIPLLDTPLLIPIQVRMVQALGRAHGKQMDTGSVLEILDLYGAGIAAQFALFGAAKLVPVVGSVSVAPLAYSLTLSIGELSDHYIQHGRNVLPRPLEAAWLEDEKLAKAFKRIFARNRAAAEAKFAENNLGDRLQQLQDAHKRGLLTDAELAAKRDALLQQL